MLILYIVLTHTFLHATVEKQHTQCTLRIFMTFLTFVVLNYWVRLEQLKLILPHLQVYTQLCAQNGN
jgi:uncharacterized membrane protein SirB2